MDKINPIPAGYTSVTPYLVVEGASELMEFMKTVFAAEQQMILPAPENKIGHAEIKLGNAIIMLADATGAYPPRQTMLHLYVDDADATYKRAIAAGAISQKEPKDEFYGDRSSAVTDKWGNFWGISTHVEEVPQAEIEKRMAAMPAC